MHLPTTICECKRCKDCKRSKQNKRSVCWRCKNGRCECQHCGQIRDRNDTQATNPRCKCDIIQPKNNTHNNTIKKTFLNN